MTFADWWESDRRFELAHEDERAQAEATWNACVAAAVRACRADALAHHEREYNLAVTDCVRAIEAMRVVPPKGTSSR